MAQLVPVALAMSGLLFLLMLLLLAFDRVLTGRKALHTPTAEAEDPAAGEAESAGQCDDTLVDLQSNWAYMVRAQDAVSRLYCATGLRPANIVVTTSPLSMLIAYGLAACLVWMRQHARAPRQPSPGLSEHDATSVAAWFAGTLSAMAAGNPARSTIERMRQAAMQAANVSSLRDGDDAAQLDNHVSWALGEHLQRLVERGAVRRIDAPASPVYAAAAAAALQVVCGRAPSSVGAMTLHDALAWVATSAGVDAKHLWLFLSASMQALAVPGKWRSLQDGVSVLSRLRSRPGAVDSRLQTFEYWAACAGRVADMIPHSEFCIVTARPDAVRVDEAGLLHCADGPSVRWPDGWSLYHWHGLRLSPDHDYIVREPQLITVQRIEAQQNHEIRRAMLEAYGAGRFAVDSGATVVDTVPPDHDIVGLRGARLLRRHLPREEEPLVFVDLVNSTPEPDGTHRRYMLRVDPQAYGGLAGLLCHAAAASTWRRADGRLAYANYTDYRPGAES